jgi:hypothetical protein
MTNVMIDRKTGNNFRQGSAEGFRDAVGATLIRLGLDPLHPSRGLIDEFAAWLYKLALLLTAASRFTKKSLSTPY